MTSPVRHHWLSGDINSAFCGGKVIRSVQCVLQIQQATNNFPWCIYNFQCFQPILCKNLSSCLYKSWFDWKETLRLQIKDLSTSHKGSANKYRIFQVLISKSCCLSLGVFASCIAPGNLLYSDARLMRLLDEVGSQSLTLRSQCAEGGRWLGPNLCPPVLTPPPASVSRKLTLRWREL